MNENNSPSEARELFPGERDAIKKRKEEADRMFLSAYEGSPSEEGWEKDFDALTVKSAAGTPLLRYTDATTIKSFIRKTLTQERERHGVSEWNKGFEKGRSEYLDKARDIDSAIANERERLAREVEGMRKKYTPKFQQSEIYVGGYNQALSDVLKLLNQDEA